MKTKRCTKCQKRLPLAKFYEHRGGLRPDCKACCSARDRRYYQEHLTEKAAYRRRYDQEHQTEKQRREREHRIKFLGKTIGVPFVLRRGVCSRCGRKRRKDERQFHLHHTRYEKRNPYLYTMELCPACHGYVTRYSVRRKIAAYRRNGKWIWLWFRVLPDTLSGEPKKKGAQGAVRLVN